MGANYNRRMKPVIAFGFLIWAPPADAFVSGPGSSCRPKHPPNSHAVSTRITCSRPDTDTTPNEAIDLPQDKSTNFKELERLEAEYYERQRLKYDKEFQMRAKMRHELESIPMEKQCHRYRWRQTETAFDVEIPMLTACEDDQLWLVVEQDQLQVAVRNDDTFGAITGFFTGKVNREECSWRIHQRDAEPYVNLRIIKMATEGTYEFWSELLQGEEESPTIRFKGKTDRYRWRQNAETIEVEIPVPADVTKRKTHLEFDPAGAWMKLSFDNIPEFEPLEGKFKGLMTPLDSVWMFDEDSMGKKVLALTLKKRREEKDCTAWWSGVFEGDDTW